MTEISNIASAASDKPAGVAPPQGAPEGNSLLDPYLNQRVSTKGSGRTSLADATPTTTSSAADQAPASVKPSDNQWTVITDLSILFDNEGKNGHMGAEDKRRNLEALVASTRGKPITIVGEMIVDDGSDVPGQPLSKSKKPYEVQKMIIHDGKETILAPERSQGVQKDLANLIEYSLKEAPSDKVALAINAHGLGNQGIQGGMAGAPGRDNGLIPVEDLTSTIHGALQAGGRDKLDVLDMDSCLMAQVGTVEQLSKVTKNLVASEETEIVGVKQSEFPGAPAREVDGQNLGAWIGDLANNPAMNGRQLSQQIVNEPFRGLNGTGDQQGTPTLSSFDMTFLPEFNQKLNNLGVELTKALADPDNRTKIRVAISNQINITNDDHLHPDQGPLASKRDLLGTVHILLQEASSGMISNPDHKLTAALHDMETFLQDRSRLMSASYAPVHRDLANKPVIIPQGNLGGVSAYVPVDGSSNPTEDTKRRRVHANDIESGANNAGWHGFLDAVQ